ncbi:MAG: hypothetical protein AAF649_01220 [Verrucomicrobiota bacterium]
MKRLLIISPHFPPVNAPDHQRVRMLLPYFEENGWKAEVLAVAASSVKAPCDVSQTGTIPENISVHRVKAISPQIIGYLGFDNLSLRSLSALKRRGNQLLQNHSYDLVFFSTTQKRCLRLGPYWLKKFKIPFAVDIQDPLVNHFYRQTGTPPPGGRIKFALSQQLGRSIENHVLTRASCLITVSNPYLHEIRSRVRELSLEHAHVIPFPYSTIDQKMARHRQLPAWAKDTRRRIILSAGRAGDDLGLAHRAFFKALKAWDKTEEFSACFVGTTYGKAADRVQRVAPLASKISSRITVAEIPERQPLLDVIRAQNHAALNSVFGSSDTRYTASKLLPVLAAGRPVLAILNKDSPAAAFLERVAPVFLCSFHTEETEETLAPRILEKLKKLLNPSGEFTVNWQDLDQLEARQQAASLSRYFNQAIS